MGIAQNPTPVDSPKAVNGVTVIPKTADQQKRSAFYEYWTAFWLAVPGALIAIGGASGQLQVLFPKYGPQVLAVCSICAALGKLARGSQMSSSVKNAAKVNYNK